MAEKISTYGAKLYLTSIALANEIANIKSINGIEASREMFETTTHADSWKTKLPGLFEFGSVPMTLVFDPQDTNHAEIITRLTGDDPNQGTRNYVITHPSNAAGTKKASWTLAGHLESYSQAEHGVEGVFEVDVTLAISGAPTYDADDTTTPA